MPTIFELVAAPEIAAYFNERADQREPYLGAALFPDKKKMGLDLSWIKGSKGVPVVLAPAAFDTKAKLRNRIGFDKLSAKMPFFKEGLLIDEAMRQELNIALQTKNQAYIDTILGNVFDDLTSLPEGAAAQRECMRMMALCTGAIAITANGQDLNYDYGMPADHKVTVSKSWSDPTADIIGDIKAAILKIKVDTGVTVTRAVCTTKTWGYLLKNDAIMKSVYPYSSSNVILEDDVVAAYIKRVLKLTVEVYDKMYKDGAGTTHQYVPDDTFVLFPSGDLGNTWFGTTPEESDLMASGVANVAIVDTGVALTTSKQIDPVTVETKCTQICLPSFEEADKVAILDVIKE